MSNAFRVRHHQVEFSPVSGEPFNRPIAIVSASDSYVNRRRTFPMKSVRSPDPRFYLACVASDKTVYGQKHGTLYKIGQQR